MALFQRRIVFALIGMLSAASFQGAQAENYPTRPVRVIVGFAPGGGTDLIARFIAQRLADNLGKPFVVENKPGAGGLLGVEAGIRSPADGYTLLMVSGSYAVIPSLHRLSFDPIADISPIVQVAEGPQLLVAHPGLPARSLEEVIALAKQNPGAITYASAGQGSVSHLSMELLCAAAGIKLLHVPYKGTGPALTDTLAGQTSLFVSGTAPLLPHVRSGKLHALVVTTMKRNPALPDVPTIDESGLTGHELLLWHGLIGPKGMPRPIIGLLNRHVAKVLSLKETAEHFQVDGVTPAGGTPEEFLSLIKKDIARWQQVVAQAGIKSD